jgi:translocation and assembly module TamA
VRLGQVFETRSEDRAVALEGLASRQGEGATARRSQAALVHLNPTWRALDNVILPTRGNAWVLQSALGYSRSQDALGVRRSGPLVRVHGRWQHFSTFDSGRGLNWRLEAGQLWSRDELGVPESLRWRAGGDESVRGYTYRGLGPTNQGEDVGGSVVWTASIEATQPLPRDWVAGLDGLSLATFVDAGQAGQSWSEVRKPAFGAGLGLRWRSPVGLLRADIARGEPAKGGGWRLHIAVGMAL